MQSQSRSLLSQIVLAFAGVYIIWGTTFLALALAIRSIPPFITGGSWVRLVRVAPTLAPTTIAMAPS